MALISLCCACSTAEPPSSTPPPASARALEYRPCPAAARVGGFTLERAEGFTAMEGRVANGVVPANVREVVASEGSCKLLRGRNLFCDPACGAGQTCGEGGSCIAFPVAQDLGALTVEGLLAPLQLTPSAVKHYSSASVTLPHPAWAADGAPITLTGSGLALAGAGVPELVVPPEDVPLVRGQPIALSWTRGSTTTKLQVLVDLAHHGGIAASIECDAIDDDGSFEIPASLAGALLDIGLAGFPKITLTRRTVDSIDHALGCVDFSVLSRVDRAIAVPGLESCATDDDCAGGKTCQGDLTCK